jgi:hypothetical protein
MADYTQLMDLEKKPKKQPASPAQQNATDTSTEQSTNPSTDKSTSRLTNRPTKQLIHQSIHRSISLPLPDTGSRVMEKPRAFYITERLNQRLDEAVRYYQEKHHLKKVDRSVLVTVMLDTEANWTEETLDVLLDKVINQMTSRLTSR